MRIKRWAAILLMPLTMGLPAESQAKVTATFTFGDGNHASFAYVVGDVAQTKAITRQVFAPPGTVCR